MSNIVDKVFDNSEDGKPNYAIHLVDGTRLYCREKLNPYQSLAMRLILLQST